MKEEVQLDSYLLNKLAVVAERHDIPVEKLIEFAIINLLTSKML